MIMAAVSWMVMYDRVSYLNKQTKANARFMKSFREVGADLTMLDRGVGDDVSTLGGRLTAGDADMMRALGALTVSITSVPWRSAIASP